MFSETASLDRAERIDVIFAPIVKGIDIGLLPTSSESELHSYAPALDADGEMVGGYSARDLIVRP